MPIFPKNDDLRRDASPAKSIGYILSPVDRGRIVPAYQSERIANVAVGHNVKDIAR